MAETDLAGPYFVSLVRRMRFDASAVSLIAANLVTAVVAVAQGWALSDLLWVYWGQNCIIGFFSYLRMFRIENSWVFPLHYGGFQFIYFLAIRELWAPVEVSWWLAACLGTFFVNHAFSFACNVRRDRSRFDDGRAVILPYARIVPMHVIILTGTFLARGAAGAVAFLVLKTAADLVMHMVEHARSNDD